MSSYHHKKNGSQYVHVCNFHSHNPDKMVPCLYPDITIVNNLLRFRSNSSVELEYLLQTTQGKLPEVAYYCHEILRTKLKEKKEMKKKKLLSENLCLFLIICLLLVLPFSNRIELNCQPFFPVCDCISFAVDSIPNYSLLLAS